LLATLLGVPWAESGVGPFCAVYLNEGLTLDFDQADGPFPLQHYCFRVSEAEFDGIVARIRARGIEYRSTPHGPANMQVNTQHGGRIVYWSEPDGHVWEALTVSYARQPRSPPPQPLPVLPKPPAPRRLVANSSTTFSFTCTTGTTTSCAMRSIGLMVKASFDRFHSDTITCPW
jgi:hypothetical protein